MYLLEFKNTDWSKKENEDFIIQLIENSSSNIKIKNKSNLAIRIHLEHFYELILNTIYLNFIYFDSIVLQNNDELLFYFLYKDM